MKVLVITRNAWDDTNAIGNTLSNFFCDIDDIEFANIYFRSALPNNKLCNKYYQTSEIDILKNWFYPQKIGRTFFINSDIIADQNGEFEKKEKKLVRVIQKYGIRFAYSLSDSLWYSEKWINANLKGFIESFSPDIMFAFVKSAPQYYLTVKFLRENYDVPLLSWIADDEYTGFKINNSQKKIKNLQYILDESSVITGCSEEICAYYNSVFKCNATPLYKGADLSKPIKEGLCNPIKIVYVGNLLYGRLDILRNISEIIEGYSLEGKTISFEIYSNSTLLSSEVQDCFAQKHCTKYMGREEYEIIMERLSMADIVLLVESFDDSQIEKTKYSFSTKVIDYLQSGSVILAVGPQEVATIKYVRQIPGTYVIDSKDHLQTELYKILSETSSFNQRAKKTREFAQKYHDSAVVSNKLAETIKKVKKGGV